MITLVWLMEHARMSKSNEWINVFLGTSDPPDKRFLIPPTLLAMWWNICMNGKISQLPAQD